MLRDVIGNADLTIWSLIALVIFVATFVAIVLYVVTRPKKEVDRQANLPLEDDSDHVEKR